MGDRLSQEEFARFIARAMEHVTRGDYDGAVRAVEQGGRVVVNHPVARNLLGNIFLQQGRKREALRAFEAAAKTAPRFPEAHCNRGVVLEQLGRDDEALAAYDRALALRTAYPLAHYNRGNCLKALTRNEEAIEAYGKAIRLQQQFPEALLNRGDAFLKSGRPIDALNDFDRAIGQRFGYREALMGRANALLALQRPEEALAIAETMLHQDAVDAAALSLRAEALDKLGRFAEEFATIEELLNLDPRNAEAWTLRSAVLKELRRFDEALIAAEEAVQLAPTSHEAHHVRATALGELDRSEEELQELEKAESLGSPAAEINWHRANTLGRLGRLAEARLLYQRALAEKPDDPALRTNYGLTLLNAGDFEQGWREHEYRLLKPDFAQRDLANLAPQWKGEDIRGKRLLVYQEQGLGDGIQFSRYLLRLASFGAEVSLLVKGKALLRLFKRSFEDIDVTDTLGVRRDFDRQISLMSLPAVFGTRLDTIPNEVPYLRADAAQTAAWRSRLGGHGFKVGLCWQGRKTYGRDRLRSIRLTAFAPLSSIAGVRIISLQAIQGVEQLEQLPSGMAVERVGLETASEVDGLVELAAIASNLDLVVSVDSAVAHLAGAMAVPVWTAIRAESEWRWLQGRADSPWYPTMRLFRQSKTGDWSEVIAHMADELRTLASQSARVGQ